MDCLEDMTDDQVDQLPEVIQVVANERAAAAANEHDFDMALIPRARQEHREARRQRHRRAFPLSDNLLALVTLVFREPARAPDFYPQLAEQECGELHP